MPNSPYTKEGNTSGDSPITVNQAGGGGASVSDTAYAASWDGVTDVAPSKNAVYDKIETLGGGTPTAITVANEVTDATCFPLFVTAATGDLGPKTNANLKFDSSTGILELLQPLIAPVSLGNIADKLRWDSDGGTGLRALTTTNTLAPIKGLTLESTIATGTAPLIVASTTKVTNLNADLLDGLEAAAFGLVSGTLAQFAATTSAQLAGVISDETGSGLLVFATSPTLTTPILGVATATSINKVALTAPATSATLTIADGKTLTVSKTMTLTSAGDSGVLTMPNATDTIMGLGVTGTITGVYTLGTDTKLLFRAAGQYIHSSAADQLDIAATTLVQIGGTAGGALLMDGLIGEYNNIATAGWGVPAIYAVGRATAQTAAKATLATYTVGSADGSFIVSGNVLVTTSTTHNFTMTVSYTDEGNTARTLTLSFSSLAGVIATTIINTGGAVPYEGVPMHIRAKASTAITVQTTGTFTSVTYNCEAVIQQVA